MFGSSLLDIPFGYPHVYRVAQVFEHPNYDSPRYHNDIALMKLAEPVPYTDTIQPACLETQDNEVDRYDQCHIVGWGDTALFGMQKVYVVFSVVP